MPQNKSRFANLDAEVYGDAEEQFPTTGEMTSRSGRSIRNLWDSSGERFSFLPEDLPFTDRLRKKYGYTIGSVPETLYEGAMGFVGSPRDLGITALTLGAGSAAKFGGKAIGEGARMLGRAMSAGYAARGIDKALNQDDPLGGAIDAGVGALGLKGFKTPPETPEKSLSTRELELESVGGVKIPSKIVNTRIAKEGDVLKGGLTLRASDIDLNPEIGKKLVKGVGDLGYDIIQLEDGRVLSTGAKPDLIPNPARTAVKSVKPGTVIERVPQTFNDAFARWSNSRSAANAQAQVDFEQLFKSLPDQELTPELLTSIQKGQASDPVAKTFRTYFDNKFQQMKEAGISVRYQQDYMPQIWKNSPEEIDRAYKSLGFKPSFTKEKIFDTYEAGIKAGLEPRFNNAKEFVRWYGSQADRAIADKQLFDWLKSKGEISGIQKGDKNAQLPADFFPVIRYGDDQIKNWFTTPAIKKALENNLKNDEGILKTAADVSTTTKNMVANFGVPFTGANAQGWNLLARKTFAEDSPINKIKAFSGGVRDMFNPEVANQRFKEINTTAPFAIKHGLTISADDFGYRHGITAERKLESVIPGSSKAEDVASNLMLKAEELFSEPLFNRIVPTWKLEHFNSRYAELSKGMLSDDAAKAAAKETNTIFGGINIQEIKRSKEFQNILRATIFAPDWAESNLKTGAGVVKSVLDPKNPIGQSYRNMAQSMVEAYLMMNVINKKLSGHYMFENPEGYQLSIDTGTKESKGKERYYNPLGTAFDFARVPYDFLNQAFQGDVSGAGTPIKNRLSVPARTAGNFIFSSDYFGNKLDTPAKQLGNLSGLVVPNVGTNLINLAQDEISPEQAFMNSLELPVRYKREAKKDPFDFFGKDNPFKLNR